MKHKTCSLNFHIPEMPCRQLVPIERQVQINTKRTALFIVDMQNDFAERGGALFVPQTRKIIRRIQKLIRKARHYGIQIVWVRDTHVPQDPEFRLFKPHCVFGSHGWEIIKNFKVKPNDIVIPKRQYFDPWLDSDIDLILREVGIDTCIMTGVLTNISVLANVASAVRRFFHVVLASDAVAAENAFDQACGLRQASFAYKAKLVRSNDVFYFVPNRRHRTAFQKAQA